ncbi:MAG: carbonic anhydrase [Magnetococcales bacterium]|nr:carbonic anhydrase [Magnetococcales bacterium]
MCDCTVGSISSHFSRQNDLGQPEGQGGVTGTTRRHVLAGLATGVASLLLLPRLSMASEKAPGVTPDDALTRLKEGNARFVAGALTHPNLTAARIAETFSGGQHPFATIISCSDSRVPVEHVFDQGIGDLFVIRVAGNVADVDEIGTAEYGAGHLGTSLVVVMGHTKCGAVTAVLKGDKVGGNIPALVDNIIPAVERAKGKGLTGDAILLEAIKENVRQSMTDLSGHSEELAHLIKEGKIKVVGALYHIENGQVEWLS